MMSIEVIMNLSFKKATEEVVYKVIENLSMKYNFDKEEALCNIGLIVIGDSKSLSREVKSKSVKSVSLSREVKSKARFALPYSGELDSLCCQGVRQSQGLYTQCGSMCMDSSVFCKSCQTSADKNNGVPEYGTIGERLKAYTEGIEYKDPSGKSPVPYAKIMKKLKVSREEVEEEAGKLNMVINPIHFETEGVKKSGRPAKLEKKPEGEVKPKGRPKKAKKVLELAGEEEDLFASLVMSANKNDSDSEDEVDEKADTVIMESEDEEEANLSAKLAAKEESKLAAKLAAEEESKLAAKLAAEEESKLAAKLAAEDEPKLAAKLAAEEESKLAAKLAAKKAAEEKKESERLEKEAKKKASEAEKEAKKKAAEAEKEAKKKAAEAEKEAKKKAAEMEKPKKPKKDEKKPATLEVSNKEMISSTVEEEEEQDVVRRFEFEGKKYLKSKKSGIIYNMEQDVIGKWNEAKQRIEFDAIEEESCDEYDE